MHWRQLLACTAVVLVAHGALIGALARHGLVLTPTPETGADGRAAARLILLDRDQVAALALARVEAPLPQAASDPAPAPKSGTAPAETGDRRLAQPGFDTASAPSLVGMSMFRSPAQLDFPVRTRSAPDISLLDGLPWSGLPIRLRLFIDSQGTVVDTQVLQSSDADEVVTRVRAMFFATGFTAGLVRGQPVPSYKDIEITVGNLPQ